MHLVTKVLVHYSEPPLYVGFYPRFMIFRSLLIMDEFYIHFLNPLAKYLVLVAKFILFEMISTSSC
jgi:hypothetical protein